MPSICIPGPGRDAVVRAGPLFRRNLARSPDHLSSPRPILALYYYSFVVVLSVPSQPRIFQVVPGVSCHRPAHMRPVHLHLLKGQRLRGCFCFRTSGRCAGYVFGTGFGGCFAPHFDGYYTM